MALDIALNQKVINAFGITQIIKTVPPSGQRHVYIVKANGRMAALKIMSSIAIDRLPREVDVYRRFSDAGLPVLIDMQAIDGRIVLLEEFVPGYNLGEIADTYKGKELEIKKILKSIINTMLPIWGAEIVHRDIKPENIIIRPDGSPVLIDFGIVKDFNAASVTDAGFQPFSPLYGAPEQYHGQKEFISHRTDLFSLGVVGFKLFYGTLPFGNTRNEIEIRFQDMSKPLVIPVDCPISDFLTECLHLPSIERPRLPSTLLSFLN